MLCQGAGEAEQGQEEQQGHNMFHRENNLEPDPEEGVEITIKREDRSTSGKSNIQDNP